MTHPVNNQALYKLIFYETTRDPPKFKSRYILNPDFNVLLKTF